MAWRRTGDPPLSEPMIAYSTDTYMRDSSMMCWFSAWAVKPSYWLHHRFFLPNPCLILWFCNLLICSIIHSVDTVPYSIWCQVYYTPKISVWAYVLGIFYTNLQIFSLLANSLSRWHFVKKLQLKSHIFLGIILSQNILVQMVPQSLFQSLNLSFQCEMLYCWLIFWLCQIRKDIFKCYFP